MNYKIIKACDIKDWQTDAHEILRKSIVLDYKEINSLSEEDEGTFEQWIKIYLKDPTFLYLVYLNDEFIGYMHNIIFTKETSEKMMMGEMRDSDINESHVVFPRFPGNYDMYCVCICFKEDHQKKGLGCILFNMLMEDIEELKNKNIYIDNIIADAYSNAGRKFFKSNGFVFPGITVDRGEIAIKKMTANYKFL